MLYFADHSARAYYLIHVRLDMEARGSLKDRWRGDIYIQTHHRTMPLCNIRSLIIDASVLFMLVLQLGVPDKCRVLQCQR